MNSFEKDWSDICRIHFFTKRYVLLAEELSLDGSTFFQPLKEHRDAYDHIVRVYAVKTGVKEVPDNESYIQENMSKALGHEYRAFFDTADWFSIVIRERINGILQGKSVNELKACYPKYLELKEKLIVLPLEIAALREGKDIGGGKGLSIYERIEKYAKLLNSITEMYVELAQAIVKCDS